jgi:DNA polymerase-3 subunit alpha
MIAYQTAYLKANYPAEFMAALITLEATHAEKMAFYLEEAKSMKLAIMPPSIAHSLIDFSVKNGAIVFGLQGIKNVGLAALEGIIAERTKKSFRDMLDFASRVDLRTVNKRVIEHLIWAGAFDSMPGNRAQKTEELSLILDTAVEKKKAALTGQMGLFDMPKQNNTDQELYIFQPRPEWSDKEKLEKEKEVMGFYVSAHPLDTYKPQLSCLALQSFEQVLAKAQQSPTKEHEVVCCGILKSKRTINTKKGDKMAFVQVEDYTQAAELVVFPTLFKKIEAWLNEYEIFIIRGTLEAGSTTCKLLANEMVPLELFFQEWKTIHHALLQVPEGISAQSMKEVSSLLPKGKIPLMVQFYENGKTLLLKTKKTIAVDIPIIEQLKTRDVKVVCQI